MKTKTDVHLLDEVLRTLGRRAPRQPSGVDRATEYARGLRALGWVHVTTEHYAHTFQKGSLYVRVHMGDHVEVQHHDATWRTMPAKARRNILLAAQRESNALAAEGSAC